MRRAAMVLIAAVAAASCGDGGGFGRMSISEASEASDGAQVEVTGFLVDEGDVLRVCEALAESFPPQCGRPSLVIEGLSIDDAFGVQNTEDSEFATVAWTNEVVLVRGAMAEGVLRAAAFTRPDS